MKAKNFFFFRDPNTAGTEANQEVDQDFSLLEQHNHTLTWVKCKLPNLYLNMDRSLFGFRKHDFLQLTPAILKGFPDEPKNNDEKPTEKERTETVFWHFCNFGLIHVFG